MRTERRLARPARCATLTGVEDTPAPEHAPGPPAAAPSSDVAALVSVRGLLEAAIRHIADASVIGRRVAAVLLDGAAEAAMPLPERARHGPIFGPQLHLMKSVL